jgi:16S rRNA (adenine1518-N6/adenine1519-N6)-dimethyltransferase
MDVRRLLREHDLKPRKGMGQNFLVSEGALGRIVAAADLEPGDVVLEVGPGLGTLTRFLAQQAGRVIAVELDQRLVEILYRTLADFSNVEIVQGDILEMEPGGAGGLSALPSGYKVVAVSVQFYGRPRIVARIPAGAFYPVPKVNSAVVRIDLYESPPVAVADVDRFFEVVRAGFGHKRKQLRNALAQGLSLPAGTVVEALRRAGLDEKRRAQTLSLEEWTQVTHGLSDKGKTKPTLRP